VRKEEYACERSKLMHGMKEIIEEAESLPVEERAMVIDSLLRSLNPPSIEIDREWMKLAKRRLAELRSGDVKPIPGNEVFAKIRERFER
jgi:putative addiction module component (TIGR02574 family)